MRSPNPGLLALLLWLLSLVITDPALAEERTARFDRDSRTLGLSGAWGHSWRYGVPGWGKTTSDVAFVGFQPQMGWFLTDRFEAYGEGTLLVYYRPGWELTGGLAGLAGRFHFWNDRSWTPYVSGGAGLLWTSLDLAELDRVFNFQVLYGIGLRLLPERGPGFTLEFRNYHISNAGSRGENLGLNSATVVGGVQWILR